MIAKSITKLIDQAIIPALILVLVKMVSLFFVSLFFNLEFRFEPRSFLGILPAVNFINIKDYIVAENYSNLAMFVAAALGTILVLIKAHFFHASHIHPKLHARLVRFNLESLISSSYHLYHMAAVWLVFLWLTVGFLVLLAIFDITYPQIAIIAFVVATNLSWFFAVDIEKEIELDRA